MSYTGPDFDPPQPRRPRRGPLTVALAALVPGALLGWVVYEAVGGGGPGGEDRTASPAPAPRTSAVSSSPSSPSALTASPGDDGKADHGRKDDDGGSASAPARPNASGPLKGKVVVVDPGHNPGNFQHTAEINRPVDIGTNRKECDTTGTSTNGGYTEARFTLDVAHRLRTLLEEQGATVKLTRDGDSPSWGPCVDERARIGNTAHADAAVSIHADGSAQGNRGFHVILPGSVHAGAADTRAIVGPSHDLGVRIAGNFVRETGEPPSNYIGEGTGLVTRTDLGGLNLSTVPKVFIECGNMRDTKDSALLTSGAWRQKAAQGISEGIVSFLRES
ncbi:N-acetylmuramoyl-L-alanine amidase [Streptomyces actinomycinicus]|uniref:N-acetylmuramoyl-L-alanine amidase n=1 Tax=Streptomyces actinomycinicus TaxID=1695166 RepID=A0A937EDN6_9ACTN|nr:N-acetylmuramoyl-L-alanine amidase [Streptomyces actinomycinicus]MBL1081007.1 N-acetylmuramoyl-L-alanine amidase [Streptomyces actinomycinicus]